MKLRPWSDNIDPATIPDDVLYSEVGRRRGAHTRNRTGGRNGGRPKTIFTCPICGKDIEGRAAFDEHIAMERKKRGRTKT